MLGTRIFVVRCLSWALTLCGLLLVAMDDAGADTDTASRQVASMGRSAPPLNPARSQSASTDLETLLATPGLSGRLNAWGTELEDVHRLIDRMSTTERQRLAQAWHDLANGMTGQSDTDTAALYLSLLVCMRDATLFATIVSTRL